MASQMQGATLLDLPEELLQSVASHFNEAQWAKGPSLTCHRLNKMRPRRSLHQSAALPMTGAESKNPSAPPIAATGPGAAAGGLQKKGCRGKLKALTKSGVQAFRQMHTAVKATVSHTIYALTPSCMTPITVDLLETTYYSAQALKRMRTAVKDAASQTIYRLTPTSRTHYKFELSQMRTSFRRVDLEELRKNWV